MILLLSLKKEKKERREEGQLINSQTFLIETSQTESIAIEFDGGTHQAGVNRLTAHFHRLLRLAICRYYSFIQQ